MASIGQMRERITIESLSKPRTKGRATAVPTASTVEAVYASVQPMTGTDRLVAEQNGMNAPTKFVFRYRSDLGSGNTEMLSSYRIAFDGKDFDVKSIVNIDHRGRIYEAIGSERA